MNKLWYSWEEMRNDCHVLVRDIVLDNFDPVVIVGLSRGGLTPGVMLSHWFKKPFKSLKSALRDFPEWEDYLPRPTDKRVLIVDDICDSGETFHRMKEHIIKKANGVDVRFATLWWNNECDFEPTYYVREIAKDSTNTWINFPWEKWWDA